MGGINKLGNSLQKDFISGTTPATTQSFTYAERVENLLTKVNKIVPLDSVLAWVPGYFTDAANTGYTSVKLGSYLELRSQSYRFFGGLYEFCDGSNCINPKSARSGSSLPDINDEVFLMGDSVDPGTSGGTNKIREHLHSDLVFSGSLSFVEAPNRYASHVHSSYAPEIGMGYLSNHWYRTKGFGFLGGCYNYFNEGDPAGGLSLNTIYSTYSNHNHGYMLIPPRYLTGSLPTWNHSHASTILGGSIGTGSFSGVLNNSDHKPRFLTCFYLIKVE